MCVDFKDLNKACLKDGYPLPKIDWKVEFLCGYPFKYFLDAYKGYHQIKIAKEDEENTTFVTSQGIFCYSKMSFELKNTGATYQRLVDKAFQKQIGRNLEVYVDELVIKSRTEQEIIRDMEETFKTLREINMKLNPKKCTFGMREGMFLGYKVNADRLRVCPNKVEAVLSFPSPKCLKNVQRLNGKLASLNRFLSKSAKKSLPFFKTLKKSELPMLTTPKEKEELVIYLAAAKEAVSAVLMMERDRKQMPIYFVSRALQGENKKADVLSKMASTSFAHLSKQVLVEELKEKSIDEREVLAVVEEEGRTWVTPIYEYLMEEILTEEKKKARAIRRKAGRYAVINEILYKSSFLGSWLRCAGPLQANYVLREIHEGSCNMHAGPRSVVAKALRSRYYWPTMHTDARKLIRECSSCQRIDMAEPFPEDPGKVKFLIVAIDYFTKWIEAKPVATITGAHIKKFIWDNIVCRFGLPGEIISDNEKQFRDNPFKDWCEKLRICQCFASVKHPQANGLMERANKSLGEGIKARLNKRSKNWVEEISRVLWAHRTMIKSSNEETPFSLTYGTEAMIPEKREQTAIQEAKRKAMMEKYYDARVHNTSFKPGDLVYRSNEASHAEEGGKLEPKWEGPYEIMKALGKGEYQLRENGSILPQTWNVCNLKKCYMHEM
nr:reverse transcriptase domain-containing protein [Tanacetum cinerariifolium]